MKALLALAALSALVAFGPDGCPPADPSAARDQITAPAEPRPLGAFPIQGFGWCVEKKPSAVGGAGIVYRVLKCEGGTLYIPFRYQPTPSFHPPTEREVRQSNTG